MRRLFLKGLLQDEVTITGDDAAHLMYAMRAKAGDEVTLVDDHGAVGRMKLTGFTADSVTMKLVERIDADTESPLGLVLAQCLLKGDKFEMVIQKAVELGAAAVQPIASRNCVVRYEGKKAIAKQQRWQKIAEEAAKQCGRTRVPEVYSVTAITEWLGNLKKTSCATLSAPSGHLPQRGRQDASLLFCYENEEQQPIKTALRTLSDDVRNISVLIGPEGGFTLDEAAAIQAAGGQPVTLGPRILRAETAAIAAMSIVQYEKGDL